MPVSVRSFAKINLGLYIGPRRPCGFHELRTIYQTISLSDTVRITLQSGTGVEVRSKDPRVPADESNTCWRIAERVLKAAKRRGRVLIQIEKALPVQGGLGAASSNAIATLFGLERELGTPLATDDRLAIAAEVGSDLPLFLVGGTVLGIGRGEQVLPLPDLPPLPLVLVTSDLGVSTPQAFAAWDALAASDPSLTGPDGAARINMFSRSALSWLMGSYAGVPAAGVGGDRAETLLLDLVRAGMENDFERVVFPQHPELREVKRVFERQGARYASLSGSGSTLYGIFDSSAAAQEAARRIAAEGLNAQTASTVTRGEYWQQLFA
jgi:4-diphosphocytidyl-2-C-methyl-D-erythritol kinase